MYRFITRDTFEERINDMIQQKKELADLTVGTGEKWLARMFDTELRNLFTLTPPTSDRTNRGMLKLMPRIWNTGLSVCVKG